MKFLVRIACMATAALVLAGCGDGDVRTGPKRTETRTLGEFQAIEVEGASRLEVTIGSPARVEVVGRDPFLKNLITEVRGDTLHVESKHRDWVAIGTSPRLTLRITMPKLTALKLEGGNDVRLRGFDGGSTNIRVEGATQLTGSGRLDQLTVFMAGAGHADLSELVAKSTKVTVAGVGSVFVHPEESLDATMNGVGAIFYAGSPRNVNTHVNGLGAIGQRDAKNKIAPKKPIDPDQLQPEYDNDEQAKGTTEVI
ncbi:MAG: GIN domain-containing protein [Povalibacter sp.]